MPLDFPAAPPPLVVGQVYGQWKWDGSKWVAAAQSYATSPYQPGPGLTINAGTTPPTIDVAKPYLPIDGSVAMTGANLLLAGDPNTNLGAATKQYVDNHAGAVTISDTAPASPRNGALWWNSVIGQLLIYYTDVNSSQWVQANVVQAAAGLTLPVTVAQGGTGVTTLAANVIPKGAGTAPLASSSISDPGTGVVIGSVPGAAAGAGTLSLPGPLVVNKNAAALPAPYVNTLLQIGTVDGQGTRIMIDAFGTGVNPIINFRQAAGTAAAPTATANLAVLGAIAGSGRGATGYASAASAAIQFQAAEAFTDSATGGQMNFVTQTPGTTGSATSRMVIRQGVIVGNSSGDPGQGALCLNANAAALPASSANLHIGAVDGAGGAAIQLDSFGGGSSLNFMRADGTNAARTALAANDTIAISNYNGWNGTAFVQGAAMIGVADGAWGAAANGGYFLYYTTAPATTTLRATMALHQGLIVGNINSSDPGYGSLCLNAAPTALVARPGAQLQIGQNTTSGTTVLTIDCYGGSVGGSPLLETRSASGTAAAPGPSQGGDLLGFWNIDGYDGSGFAPGASIRAYTQQVWSAGNHGTSLGFFTTPNGSTMGAATPLMQIFNGVQVWTPTGGDKGIGTVNAQGLYVNGVAVSTSDRRLKSAIQPSTTDALWVLKGIPLYDYEWSDGGRHDRCGFVAQQVPEQLRIPGPTEDDMIGVDTLQMTAHLVRAVQQLAERLERAGI